MKSILKKSRKMMKIDALKPKTPFIFKKLTRIEIENFKKALNFKPVIFSSLMPIEPHITDAFDKRIRNLHIHVIKNRK